MRCRAYFRWDQERYRYDRTIFVAEMVRVIVAGEFAGCGPLSNEEAVAIHVPARCVIKGDFRTLARARSALSRVILA